VFDLTLSHTRAHVYRALLESYGCDLRRGLRYLKDRSIPVRRLVAVGGGARSEVWRQIVSDVTGTPQEYARHGGAPLGDAFLAAYGLGFLQEVDRISSWLTIESVTEPRAEAHAAYAQCFERFLRLREAVRSHSVLVADAPPTEQ
jgi:sugar (pentulose or hexulose) kinase